MKTVIIILLTGLLISCGAPTPNKNSKIYEPTSDDIRNSKSIEYLKSLVKKDGGDSDVHFKLAKIYFEKEQFDDCLNSIEKAVKIKPLELDYCLLKVKVLNRLQRYEEVIAVDVALAKNNIDKPAEFYEELAWSSTMLGEYELSTTNISKFGRTTDRITYLKSLNWLHKEDTAMALSELNKLDLNKINFQEPYVTLTNIRLDRNELANARQLIELSKVNGFSDTLLWKEKAKYYRLMNYNDKALLVYKQMSSDYPGHYSSNRTLGLHFYLKGLSESNTYFDSSLVYYSQLKNNARLDDYRCMALACKKLRRYDDALEYFKKVVEIAPSDSIADIEIPDIVRRINYIAKMRQVPANTNNND